MANNVDTTKWLTRKEAARCIGIREEIIDELVERRILRQRIFDGTAYFSAEEANAMAPSVMNLEKSKKSANDLIAKREEALEKKLAEMDAAKARYEKEKTEFEAARQAFSEQREAYLKRTGMFADYDNLFRPLIQNSIIVIAKINQWKMQEQERQIVSMLSEYKPIEVIASELGIGAEYVRSVTTRILNLLRRDLRLGDGTTKSE